jgi:hypothetical protein
MFGRAEHSMVCRAAKTPFGGCWDVFLLATA